MLAKPKLLLVTSELAVVGLLIMFDWLDDTGDELADEEEFEAAAAARASAFEILVASC